MLLLAVIAVGYGFTVIPSPTEQRDKNYDATREGDLENISYAIDDYDYAYDRLPDNLSQIDLTTYIYDDEKKRSYLEDPQTKIPYEYVVTSPTSYKLCATFGAESDEYDASVPDEYNRDITNHPKGYYCFVREVYRYEEDDETVDREISPSPLPLPSINCIKAPCTTGTVPSPTVYYMQDKPETAPTRVMMPQ